MEVVVTTGAIRRAKTQLNRPNTQLFTDWMPFLSPKNYYHNNDNTMKAVARRPPAGHVINASWSLQPFAADYQSQMNEFWLAEMQICDRFSSDQVFAKCCCNVLGNK